MSKIFLFALSFANRIGSILFNYLLTRLLSVSDFGFYSAVLSYANYANQFGRLGYDYEFQRLISKNNLFKEKYLATYFFYTLAFSVISSCIIFCFLKINANFIEMPFLFNGYIFALLVFFIYISSSIIICSYASFNYRLLFYHVILQSLMYLIAFLIVLNNYEYLLLVYIGSMGSCCSIYIFAKIVGPFNLGKSNFFGNSLKHSLNVLRRCFNSSFSIYVYNVLIATFQVLLINLFTWKNVAAIANYRILQTIASISAIAPLLILQPLINKSLKPTKSSTGYLATLIFIIFSSLSIFAIKFLVSIFPKYKFAIENYLYIFLGLYILTMFSQALIVQKFHTLNIKRFYYSLFFALVLNVTLLYKVELDSLRDLIFFDWILQLVFFIVLLFSIESKRYFPKIKDIFSIFFVIAIFFSCFLLNPNYQIVYAAVNLTIAAMLILFFVLDLRKEVRCLTEQ